jgi:hypothetical protein
LERVRTGIGFDKAIDGIVLVKINIDLAEETQFSRGFGESKDGDGITIDVAQPANVGLRLDFETRVFDMDIVSLARPQQRAVRPECDRCTVIVLRFVGNSDTFHERVGESGRSPFSINSRSA